LLDGGGLDTGAVLAGDAGRAFAAAVLPGGCLDGGGAVLVDLVLDCATADLLAGGRLASLPYLSAAGKIVMKRCKRERRAAGEQHLDLGSRRLLIAVGAHGSRCKK
jgi:hypothetical protein